MDLINMHQNKEEAINEALAILEEETDRRINDLTQRIDFICAALRAQGNTQINRMLHSVRQLTIEEFCGTYGADVEKFLNAQAKQRSVDSAENSKKRVNIDDRDIEKHSAPNRRRSTSIADDIEKTSQIKNDKDEESEAAIGNQQQDQQQKTVDCFNLQIKREGLSNVSIELDPELSCSETEQLIIDEPNNISDQLDDQQKKRILQQISKLQEALNAYREKLV